MKKLPAKGVPFSRAPACSRARSKWQKAKAPLFVRESSVAGRIFKFVLVCYPDVLYDLFKKNKKGKARQTGVWSVARGRYRIFAHYL